MKRKSPQVNFRMSFASFILTAKFKLNFIRRDSAEFLKFGITETSLDEANEKLSNFTDIPTDDELVGNQIIATEAKDAQAIKIRGIIASIMTRAENKFGSNTSRYRRFGINSISILKDQQLLLSARRVYRIARLFLADLASEGLTTAILDEFKMDIDLFDDLLNAQEDAIGERDTATEYRIEKANELYKLIAKYCDTGKRIWESVSEARYNDYVIYDTPSSAKPEPEIPTFDERTA